MFGKIIFVILLVSTLLVGCGGSSRTKKNKTLGPPVVVSMAGIRKYDGKQVTLEGVFMIKNAGKTKVTYIKLSDGTGVIYRYTNDKAALKRYGKKTVQVIGRVSKSYPKTDQPRQWLMAPHVVDVSSVLPK